MVADRADQPLVKMHTRAARRAVAVTAAAVVALTLGAGSAGAVTPSRGRPPKQGAACLPGHWKLDLGRLVAEASTTQTLTPSGSVDLVMRRNGDLLQTYADTLTGETTSPTGTVKVEQKYAGAVSAHYRVSAHRRASGAIDLTSIDNATEMVMTVSVNGIAAAPRREAPAPGTQTDAVTLAFTCRGDALELSVGGAVAQHYQRLS